MRFGTYPGKLLRLGFFATTAAVLAACQEGTFATTGVASDNNAAGGTVEYEEIEVEAPEVFQMTTNALWDGRPSLGGVWVSLPDTKMVERVSMINKTNGKTVVGALFPRDFSIPGPRLQLSSAAATALDVLPGAPTQLQVTALKMREVPVSVPQERAAPAPVDGPEEVEATALAAIEAAEEGTNAAAKSTKNTVKNAAEAADKPETKTETTKTASAKTVEPRTAPAKKTEPKAVAAAPTASGATSLPYIQVGFYGVESNATASSEALGKAGISARIVRTTSRGKPYWRVLAGPAASNAEANKLLNAVKGLGYKDAYAVKG